MKSSPYPNSPSGVNKVLFYPQDSYERARTLLKTYSQEHENLAGALLRHETLDAKEIRLVLEGKALDH